MAITDDFDFIGAATDDFDCDASTGWTPGGSAKTGAGEPATNTLGVDGGTSIDLVADTVGECTWTHDIGSGNRFKITEKVLNMWFYYLKGKNADPYIGTGNNAISIRLYFGGTVKYAEYWVAPGGDNVLIFGWQPFTISGKNMNGGSVAGGHNNGTDWELEIHRIVFVIQFNLANDAGGAGTNYPETPLRMDNWEIGTKLVVSDGTPTVPIGFADLVSYSNGTGRTNGPIGMVQARDTFINIKCGIDIGDGTDGAGEGNISDDGKFILFNQWSEEVKANLKVTEFSSLILGIKEAGTDGNYAVSGCQIVLPASRFSDITIEDGAVLRLYDCKIYRWRDVFFGGATETTGSTAELNRVQLDSCETAYFRATNLDLQDIEIYNNTANTRNQCAEMSVSPDTCSNLLVHDCAEGIHFRDDITIEEYFAQDNDGADLAILSNKTLTVVNGFFDETNLKEVTS